MHPVVKRFPGKRRKDKIVEAAPAGTGIHGLRIWSSRYLRMT
jgi:hypothetical protein